MEYKDLINKKLFFIDFESNKKGDTFLLGVKEGISQETWVINENLKPLCDNINYADRFNIKYSDGKTVLLNLFKKIKASDGMIVAYSNAELNIIKSMIPEDLIPDIKYINLARVAKTWKNKFHKKDYENLPEFRKNKNKFIATKFSLASIMRLLINGIQAPSDYAPGKTTARINAIIAGLKSNKNKFCDLTSVQKQKATKLLKHNFFDVAAMENLYNHIVSLDCSCFRKGIVSLKYDEKICIN